MRRIVLGLVVICFVLSGSVPGWAVELESPDRVDVYPRGVMATWVLQAESEMNIRLPMSFTTERLTYLEVDGAEVQRMSAVTEGAADFIPPALVSLFAEISEQRGRLEALQAEYAGIQQTIAYLTSGIDIGGAEDPLAVLNQLRSLRTETERERQALSQAIDAAETHYGELNSTLRSWYSADLGSVRRITLSTNGQGKVEFSAFSPHAQWMPTYRVSLDSNSRTMDLESSIAVRQQTGIAWDGLVVCHTAAPADHVSVPTLRPLVARLEEDAPAPRAMREDFRVQESMAFDEKAMEEAFDMLMVEGEAGISLIGRGKVAADGKEALLSVGRDTYPVGLFATLVPAQQDTAWLLAETEQPVRSLLRGTAELMVDGSFTGTTMLEHMGGGEVLDMAFGRSPLIKATREPVVYTERQTWLGRRVLRDGYEITVHNGSARDVAIVVKDRIPVVGHERINIKSTIDPAPDDAEDGILTWRLDLEPDSSFVIAVEYEIDYPDRMRLNIR